MLGSIPAPKLKRQADRPMPEFVVKSRSATTVLLVSDHNPTFCMHQASDALKMSMVCWIEVQLATALTAARPVTRDMRNRQAPETRKVGNPKMENHRGSENPVCECAGSGFML